MFLSAFVLKKLHRDITLSIPYDCDFPNFGNQIKDCLTISYSEAFQVNSRSPIDV